MAVALAPADAPAQARLELTPFLGGYTPTQYLASSSTGWTLRQESGLLFAGAATIWLTHWLGVEGSLGYSPWGTSYPVSSIYCGEDTATLMRARRLAHPAGPALQSPCDNGFIGFAGWEPPTSSGGVVTLVGGRVLLNVPLSRRISLYGTAGATSISHSGIGTDRASVSYLGGMDFPTAHGTVAGAGVRVALRDGLALRLEVVDYHYTMQVNGDGRGTLGNKVQDDFVAMTGISIAPFGFRGSAQQ